nr:DUF3426 domain-containing protein [Aliikangiella sp. G2MR2-5]
MIVVLVLALLGYAGQSFWKNRQTLSWDPTWGSMTKSICSALPCDLQPRRDVAKIKLRQRIVKPSESDDSILEIKLLLVNEANFAQPYPGITIRFSDRDGSFVSQKRFEVSDYFPEKAEQFMPANAEVHLTFETKLPHPDALGFEFLFD